jgi:O6-methylguanine-DNA--protein-cysteine methyltransferase
MTFTYRFIESPVGQLKLIAKGARLAAVLWPNDRPNRVLLGPMDEDSTSDILEQTAQQLSEYFAGRRQAFDLALEFHGTDFQRRVWQALLSIPFGETRSYLDIAVQIGNPAAVRAVGAANGPLSVDLENGYSDDPLEVAEHVKRVLEVGAVGINIEDATDTPELLARKIEAIKSMAARNGLDVFVNARTDVYLAGLVTDELRVEETLKRGRLYQQAGADGLFVAALVDIEQIKTVVAGVGLPINLLARQGLPDADALARLGVRRLSAGSSIAQTLWGHAEQLARGFLQDGRSEAVTETSLAYPQIQALFGR